MMTHLERITPSQIKFKIKTWNSSLCDYSDAYILVKGTMIITGTQVEENATTKQTKRGAYKRNKGVIFKNVHHLLIAQVK